MSAEPIPMRRLDAETLAPEAINAAIRTIESSRRTHVNWAEYRREGGTDDTGAGDLAHHEEMEHQYTHVLRVLRSFRRRGVTR